MSHFAFFVPAYNAENHLRRCLNSVHAVEYPNFEVILVDDASTDSTGDIMDEFADLSHVQCTVFHNDENLRMPHTLWDAIKKLPNGDDDVFFLLDGDDFLPHKDVLNILNGFYSDHGLWLTYGSFLRYPDPYNVMNQAIPYPRSVIKERRYRKYYRNCYNHPITFRRHLFDHIEEKELRDNDGRWFGAAYDHALIIPMLELASPNHFTWVPDFLYVYNEENENSEFRDEKKNAEAARTHSVVDGRSPREPHESNVWPD